MGFLQCRQRPFSSSQPRTGIFSRLLNRCKHLGQREGGCTSDNPAGKRYTTTFKKLPIEAPRMKTAIVTGNSNKTSMSDLRWGDGCSARSSHNDQVTPFHLNPHMVMAKGMTKKTGDTLERDRVAIP